MNRVDTIKQHLADLSSSDTEKVRVAYEWLTANARENARMLIATLEAQKPVQFTGTMLNKVNALLHDLHGDDVEQAKQAREYFSDPDKSAALVEVLFKEAAGNFDVLSAAAELICEWLIFANKSKWRITKDLKDRTDRTLKALDAYMEIKER